MIIPLESLEKVVDKTTCKTGSKMRLYSTTGQLETNAKRTRSKIGKI